jgi:hypothetical protein
MSLLLLAAPVLSFLILAAHFLRQGAWVPAAACVVLAVLVAWRRPGIQRLLQAALLGGTVEWLWTAFTLTQRRMAEGQPWGRMAVILGVVALVTAGSILAIEASRRRRAISSQGDS